MVHLAQEQLRVVLLDRRNRLIDAPIVYQGGQTETSVRLAECFREAVRCAAAALAMVHCRPAGDPTPSPEDVQLTSEAGEAGVLLGIDALDHVVIAGDGFVACVKPGRTSHHHRERDLPTRPCRLEPRTDYSMSVGARVLKPRVGHNWRQCETPVPDPEPNRRGCQR